KSRGRWRERETMKRVLGEEHPSTLSSMANLAFTWKDQGRSGDALALMRNCVILQERALGADHPLAVFRAETLADWEEVNTLS
ncbi:hypothetical protein EDB80DRAFT_565208, partial [Ilyonectria destructans]